MGKIHRKMKISAGKVLEKRGEKEKKGGKRRKKGEKGG